MYFGKWILLMFVMSFAQLAAAQIRRAHPCDRRQALPPAGPDRHVAGGLGGKPVSLSWRSHHRCQGSNTDPDLWRLFHDRGSQNMVLTTLPPFA